MAEIGTDPRFGEQGGRLSYGSYLHLERLLSAQQPLADPPAHDELLFITIHQVYELWFALLLHELSDARDTMLAGESYAPRLRLQRCRVIEAVLVEQVDVLDTMKPQDFLTFRSQLAPASGFQSVQFREVEFLSGAKDPAFVDRLRGLSDDERDRLVRRLREPTVWDAYLQLLAGHGFAVADVDARRTSLRTISADRDTHGPLWDLAEALLEHDQAMATWRARHVLMVERQIGTKSGTGGSSGAPYLRSRLDLRFYPELWELRAAL